MNHIHSGKRVILHFLAVFPFCAGLAIFNPSTSRAADAYFHIPLAKLNLTEGSLPAGDSVGNPRSWPLMQLIQPYATLDGAGEIYVSASRPIWQRGNNAPGQAISVCAPEGREITGRLFLPKPDFSGLVQVRFRISSTNASPAARSEFLGEKQQFYQQLQDRNLPGAAWFRHQVAVTAAQRGTKPGAANNFNRRFNRFDPFTVEGTFDLFSGSRALSENLQLDRALPPISTNATNLENITNLAGITVSPMDWKPLLAKTQPALDPLAAFVPADQHAIFFPSFTALTTMIDEAEANGTPLLQSFEARSEDAGSRERYQKQLCLGLNDLARLLGPQVVASAAFTGSDPYLRAGTDLAVLFETPNPHLILATVAAQQAAAQAADARVKPVSGKMAGVPFVGALAPDRSVSSYLASVSNVVFVANSRKQLEYLVRTALGQSAALSSQDEYVYFRQQYPRGADNETAFLVLSDATIRRWCGPLWRIADSRRTRAAAVLSELQAAHLDELVRHQAVSAALHSDYFVPDLGELKLTPAGVASSTYGTLDFLTPVSELSLAAVTPEEAQAYGRWRDNYQSNWRQYFDPIAVRFSVSPSKLAADLIVMPLIAGTQYHQFVDFTMGAQIAPDAGDPHSTALARLALAINPQSQAVQEAGNLVGNMAPGLKANFLSWLGQSITLYADDDGFWSDLNAATNTELFLEHAYARLPVALYCEVKSSMGVVAFLTALHAFVDQSAPKMTRWQNLEYNGRPYVKITPDKLSDPSGDGPDADWSVYYAVTPDSLTITLSEPLLKRALNRQAARIGGQATNLITKPWLGRNLGFQIEQKLISILLKATHDGYQTQLQTLSWNNLPILNEWKRLYPEQDPVKLHQQIWGEQLICPGGGKYVWNESWQTMESTALGHPGNPKAGDFASPLASLVDANLGLTFENQGLRANVVLNRSVGK